MSQKINPLVKRAVRAKTGIDIDEFAAEMLQSLAELRACHDMAALLVPDYVHVALHKSAIAEVSMSQSAEAVAAFAGQEDPEGTKAMGICLYKTLQYAAEKAAGAEAVQKIKDRWNI